MGGNAFKTCTTRRMALAEYQALIARLSPYVSTLYERTAVPQSVHNKEDFGDLDFLVAGPIADDPPALIAERFHSKERVRSGPVTSVEVDEFQVDLICVTLPTFDYALTFYNWNGFGMLRGVLARSLGLKDGAEGLRAPVFFSPVVDNDEDYAQMMVKLRNGNLDPAKVIDYNTDAGAVMGFVLLSLDHEEVLRFLDLDVETCRRGFGTMDELCSYFTSTKYFMPSAFSKHGGKQRIMQRLGEFLHKCVLPPGSAAFSEENGDIRRAERSLFRKLAVRHFGKTAEWNAMVETERIRRQYKTMFGSKVVRNITSMSGRDLGEVMKKVKKKVPLSAPDISRTLNSLDESGVRAIIEECWHRYTAERPQTLMCESACTRDGYNIETAAV
ncbi:hypothetical protein HDU87_000929 [Geranomyces variabilis]|uniref:Uncharacterized protein n=1 Tax=Geranomyces variabilis TaxID=109894 RepID=A0AAD5TBN1_9FUNG|nr:hypothetical protein HDU87_000929 [Geranomyces variabilis]